MGKARRIMVCVTQQKSCERLIKRGAELAQGKRDKVFVIHIVKENWKYFGQLNEPDAMEYLYQKAKAYGAELHVVKATDIEITLSQYAKKSRIDTIVMGESFESSEQQSMIGRLQEKTTKEIIFDIVPFEDSHSMPVGANEK